MKSSDAEMKERKALVGSTTTQTFFSKALADLQLEQGQSGRFTDKASVTGREPFVKYPSQPPDSPWSGDLTGTEPSLGYAINDLEVTGEQHELAASLLASGAASEATAGLSIPPAGAETPPAVLSPVGGVSPLLRGRRL